MKLGKFLSMGMLSVLVFTACVDNDDKSEWNDGSQPINFTSSIQGVKSRAVDNKWTAGDKVGIFMKAANGDLSAATAANKLHTTDQDGNLSASNAENALYYPTDGSSVDFVAYYPFTTSLAGNVYKVDVATQTDQPAIDLLYSNNAKGFAKGTAAKPQLQFVHKLSQIVFNIEKDATIPTLDGLKVTFRGMNTKADFALADGTLSNAGTVTDINAVVDVPAAVAKTIVLPAAALADVKVVFELNSKTYIADYPQADLEGARKYIHTVKLSDSNGQPVIEMAPATITDWIEVPGGDIDVDFGGGSVTPGEDVTLIDESFNENIGSFTIDNKNLPSELTFVWNHSVHNNAGFMKASAYKSGTKYASESWLVSPAIDLSEATKATLTFMHCDNNSAGVRTEEMTLWMTEATAENWEQVTIPNYGAGTDYVYVPSGDIDLTKYAGKSMKFAFKYTSSAASSATWQIKDLKVVANGGSVVDPDPTDPDVPKPGEEVVFIDESFGDPVKSGNYYPNLDAYTGWTDTHNLTYTDPLQTSSYSNASIRKTTAMDGHVWFPAGANKDCALKISGFDTSKCTNLKLTYDITANAAGDQNVITVSTNNGDVVVPSKAVASNTYQSVELALPDGATYIQFTSLGTNNTIGFRVDNVKLVGVGK